MYKPKHFITQSYKHMIFKVYFINSGVIAILGDISLAEILFYLLSFFLVFT
jgi:hypothetical protein